MTFHLLLALMLIAICVIGLAVVIPQMVKGVERTLTIAGLPLPSRKLLVSGITMQNLFMILVAVAAGVWLAPSVGLNAPVLEAVLSGESIWQSLKPQLLPGIIAGFAAIVLFIPMYYSLFLRHLDFQTIWAVENQRMSLNLWGRLLYNGMIEEVIARWGLMTVLVWLINLLPGGNSSIFIWLAIIMSGILFALLYLPEYYAAGSVKSAVFHGLIAFIYLLKAIIFGWLFWKYGLEAAIIAHMVFQLIWYPYDMRLNIAKNLET